MGDDDTPKEMRKRKKVFLLHPNMPFMQKWDAAMTFLLLFTAVVTPFEVAFLAEDGAFLKARLACGERAFHPVHGSLACVCCSSPARPHALARRCLPPCLPPCPRTVSNDTAMYASREG